MIFPPRPQVQCSPDRINTFDTGEYLAQPKLNGSCAILQLSDIESPKVWSRHNDLLSGVKDLNFQDLYRGSGDLLLCGEYMNKSQEGVNGPFNHKFVIFDIIKYNGVALIGSTTQERIDMLNGLYGSLSMVVNSQGQIEEEPYLYYIKEDVYRVASFMQGFKLLFDEMIKYQAYEGLVMKRKDAKLEPGFNENNNGGWQIKCRKPTKNYQF